MQQQNKFVMTPQRRIILEELNKLKNHPTADDLYEAIRTRMPKISLGTVYRNLEMLSEQGMIKKIELTSAQKRFDHKKEHHYHLRCIHCGQIEDAPIDPDYSLEQHIKMNTDFEITGHNLEFTGICPKCKANC